MIQKQKGGIPKIYPKNRRIVKETLVFTRLFRVVSNVADFEVVEWCMCENEVVRVLRMVGCKCRVVSVLVDCVIVVMNVHVKGVA